jgi:hypothetical protein
LAAFRLALTLYKRKPDFGPVPNKIDASITIKVAKLCAFCLQTTDGALSPYLYGTWASVNPRTD